MNGKMGKRQKDMEFLSGREGFLTGKRVGSLANLAVPVSICRVEKVAKPDGGADGRKP